ncbi:MAG TPA: hypothetical protein VMU65_02130 [Candidatus Saccharimonadales bacterium]|nr:hypothetical protein [Candidatus Saccharimonadales bacterium]
MSSAPHDGDADAGRTDASAPDKTEARDAALDAVEPERLLDGEVEDTRHADDALHWAKVYAELLDFKRGLLGVAEQRVESMDEAAGDEVKKTDMKVLLAERERFERRLEFWRRRAQILQDQAGTPVG